MRIFAFVLLFWWIPAMSKVSAQSADSQCHVREVFNRKGWNIPGLSKTKTRTSHARYSQADYDSVFVDILESQAQEDSVTFVWCGDRTDRMEIAIRPVEIKEIQRFTSNDRVFGYLVTAVPIGKGTNGEVAHAASEDHLYFYDPDGSGKFTLMRYAGEMFFKITIPNWAKQKHN